MKFICYSLLFVSFFVFVPTAESSKADSVGSFFSKAENLWGPLVSSSRPNNSEQGRFQRKKETSFAAEQASRTSLSRGKKPTVPTKPKSLRNLVKLSSTYRESKFNPRSLALPLLYTNEIPPRLILDARGNFKMPEEEALLMLEKLGFQKVNARQIIFQSPHLRIKKIMLFKERHAIDLESKEGREFKEYVSDLLKAIQEHNHKVGKRAKSVSGIDRKKLGGYYLIIQEHRLIEIYRKINSREPLIRSDLDAYIFDANLIAKMYNAVIEKEDQMPRKD